MKALTHEPFSPKAISIGHHARTCARYAACAARWSEFFEANAQKIQTHYESARRAHLLEQARINRKKARRNTSRQRTYGRKPTPAQIEKLRTELTALDMPKEMINNLLAKAETVRL